jgi:hypothetical protein
MRKKLFLVVVILAIMGFVESVPAQLEKGQTELSFGASFMAIDNGETYTAFNLPARFGYFITREFEIEPEIIFSAYKGGDPGLILSFNFLYNLSLDQSCRVSPFFLAGGGWTNSLHYFNQMNFGDTERDYTVLNLGLGSKFFLSSSAALRFEYRFQRFFAKKVKYGYWGYQSTYDPSLSYHNILFGLSIFL